jgi:hypothetical protein
VKVCQELFGCCAQSQFADSLSGKIFRRAAPTVKVARTLPPTRNERTVPRRCARRTTCAKTRRRRSRAARRRGRRRARGCSFATVRLSGVARIYGFSETAVGPSCSHF